MSSVFYKSIIDDEIVSFGIKKDALKVAGNSVRRTYCQKALRKGNTFLDYNLPSNRCAYLYRYAPIHTSLVTKYFRVLMQKKQIKLTLKGKESLKICCLGGGPGNDIVGLFKALALNPNYHKKVVEVSVLDICGGWRNSFKRVIESLKAGKVKGIPQTFFDDKNFKCKLLEVDLLKELHANVVTILSEADIICMVKFVSAILGSSESFSAVETIGKKLKVGAIVLFIDNFNGNVFEPLTEIADHVGLHIVIGPLHIAFNPKVGFKHHPITAAEKETFGCLPCYATKVTVLCFLKGNVLCDKSIKNKAALTSEKDLDNDDGWGTDKDSEEVSTKYLSKIIVAKKHKKRNRNNKSKKSQKLLKLTENITIPNENLSQTEILLKVAKNKKTVQSSKFNENLVEKTTQSPKLTKNVTETHDHLQKLTIALSSTSESLPKATEISTKATENLSKFSIASPKNALLFPKSREVLSQTTKSLQNVTETLSNTNKNLPKTTHNLTKTTESLSNLSITSLKNTLLFPETEKVLFETKETFKKSAIILSKASCDKYTQTSKKYLSKDDCTDDIQVSASASRELTKLVDSLCEFVDVLKQWQQKRVQDTYCEHHCHCHC